LLSAGGRIPRIPWTIKNADDPMERSRNGKEPVPGHKPIAMHPKNFETSQSKTERVSILVHRPKRTDQACLEKLMQTNKIARHELSHLKAPVHQSIFRPNGSSPLLRPTTRSVHLIGWLGGGEGRNGLYERVPVASLGKAWQILGDASRNDCSSPLTGGASGQMKGTDPADLPVIMQQRNS
jgi:hypothetical protein